MFGPASARAPTSARKAYDELLVQQLNNWIRVIGKDERFVGLMPWHWPNLPTNIAPKYQLGAVAFTRLLEGVAAIKPPSLKSDDDDPVVVFRICPPAKPGLQCWAFQRVKSCYLQVCFLPGICLIWALY